MKYILHILSISISALFIFSSPYNASAHEADTSIPPHDWPHEISDIKPNPKVIYGKLANGFRYAFMPNDQLPKHFSIRLYIKAGSINEEEHEQGLAHFLEHMAFNGIKGYPKDQMIQTLQRLGVPFGSHNNACTFTDKTTYELDFMDNSLEHLDHGLKIIAGIADGMLLEPELIEKEKGVILAEKCSSHSANYKLYCDYQDFLYKGLLTNNRRPIGLESVIKAANPTLLRNFYKKWYRPERMMLIIVGDLDRQAVESRIQEYFSSFSDLLDAPNEPDLGTLQYNQGLQIRIYKDEELSAIDLDFVSLKPYQKKIHNTTSVKESIYMDIALTILYERLCQLTKQENCPFRNPYASNGCHYNLSEYSKIAVQCQPEQILEALTAIENELRRTFEYGFTQEEFNCAVRESLYKYKTNQALDETSKTAALIETLLNAITNESVFASYQTAYEITKPFLENEANKDECLKVFKDSWNMDNLFIHLSTNSNTQYTPDQLKKNLLQK